jgi:AcrR family transcriptional regulator
VSQGGERNSRSNSNLVEQAIIAVAHDGLDGVSLRKIANAAGVSTASIFHFFQNKSGMLDAALHRALELEETFHAQLLSELKGLEINSRILGDLVTSYVARRVGRDVPLFWLEVIFNGEGQFPGAWAVEQWNAIRRNFWSELLWQPNEDHGLAHFLATSLILEETYAVALHDDVTFWPLMAETVRAMSARSFCEAGGALPGTIVGPFLLAKPRQFAVNELGSPDTIANKLLNAASERIFTKGVRSIKDREISRIAQTSSSMIAYHFGGSSNFLCKAIWRAMLHDVPKLLDPAIQAESRRDEIDDWAAVAMGMVQPGVGDNEPGFYLGYTRITGQAALLAARQPELIPLIRHLRIIEGTGTYRASRLYWPNSTSFDEAHAMAFGIWIKGAAMLNYVLQVDNERCRQALLRAAKFFAAA